MASRESRAVELAAADGVGRDLFAALGGGTP